MLLKNKLECLSQKIFRVAVFFSTKAGELTLPLPNTTYNFQPLTHVSDKALNVSQEQAHKLAYFFSKRQWQVRL
jgi:hypothetical protein